MIIIGVILALAGLGSLIVGFVMNNSFEAQLSSFLNSGQVNPGTVWIVIGIIALIVGIILVIAGVIRKR